MSIEGSGATNGAHSASETAQRIAKNARATVSDLAEQASAATDDLVSRATDAVDRVHLTIRDNPYEIAGMAVLAGALNALWLRYTGPDTTLSFAIMLDILLMVVIGGMGTLYGSAVGATLFVVAQNYLQDLMKLGSDAMKGLPLLPDLLHPDRWLLWLGLLFIVCVYYFPYGIVGRLRAGARP